MNKKHRVMQIVILVTLLLTVTGAALAAGGYEVRWSVIGGGGGHTEMGDYRIESTIGQGIAGWTSMGDYELCAGFWCGAESIIKMFMPLIKN
jgi:hypothetical protein